MTFSPVGLRETPPARAHLLPLLALLWVVAPLWLGFAGVIVAAPLFGEQPTAAEQAQSSLLLASAGACAVLLPLAGALLARSLHRRRTETAFWVATALGVLALAAGGVVLGSPSA